MSKEYCPSTFTILHGQLQAKTSAKTGQDRSTFNLVPGAWSKFVDKK